MIYEATPPGRGGGLGLFRTAMNLWEQFRDGGVRDQERARMEADEQQRRLGEQAFQQNAFNLQQMPIDAQFKAETHKTNQDTAKQQLGHYDWVNNRDKAQASVGKLPDMTPFELSPPAAELGGWTGATGEELGARLEQTPWANLNREERKVVGKVPGQFSDLSPLDLSGAWDNTVGANTGGAAGNAPVESSSTAGKTTTTYKPAGQLASQRKFDQGVALNKSAQELMAKFGSERAVQKYITSRTSAEILRNHVAQSAKNPSGATDISILTEFMRSIDPESTVREGEFHLAAKSGALPDVVMGYYNQIVGNGKLTQNVRNQILETAQRNTEGHRHNADKVRQLYGEYATRLGLDPEHYFSDFKSLGAPASGSAGGAPATPEGQTSSFNSAADFNSAQVDPAQQVTVFDGGRKFVGTAAEAREAFKNAPATPAETASPATPVSDNAPTLRKVARSVSNALAGSDIPDSAEMNKLLAEEKAQGGEGGSVSPGTDRLAPSLPLIGNAILDTYWRTPAEIEARQPAIRHAPLPLPQKPFVPPQQPPRDVVGTLPQVDFSNLDAFLPYIRQATQVTPQGAPLPPLSNEDILRLMVLINGPFVQGIPQQYQPPKR